jgi:DNA-directed RNA polymerase specialized sigma24 family protein
MCGYCDWTSPDDCLVCEQKCIECDLDHVSRTAELELLLNGDYEDDTPVWETIADDDPFLECLESAKTEALEAALDELSDDERKLWGYLVDGFTEREIAPLLGLKERKSVNKRKARLFEKLAANATLRDFYEDN